MVGFSRGPQDTFSPLDQLSLLHILGAGGDHSIVTDFMLKLSHGLGGAWQAPLSPKQNFL